MVEALTCMTIYLVDVPGCYADDVLKAMAHAKIKGKNIHVEKPIPTEGKSGSYRPEPQPGRTSYLPGCACIYILPEV